MIDPILHHTLGLEAEVRRLTAENASLRQQLAAMREQVPAPIGEAGTMPGTSGFTLATFRAEDVPVGTKLYAAPVPPADAVRDAELNSEIANWLLVTAKTLSDVGHFAAAAENERYAATLAAKGDGQ